MSNILFDRLQKRSRLYFIVTNQSHEGDTMATFKNKLFKSRDYEAQNVVACQCDSNPDETIWEECGEEVLSGLSQLWKQSQKIGGKVETITLFGYL